jgi:hypothetical protein
VSEPLPLRLYWAVVPARHFAASLAQPEFKALFPLDKKPEAQAYADGCAGVLVPAAVQGVVCLGLTETS